MEESRLRSFQKTVDMDMGKINCAMALVDQSSREQDGRVLERLEKPWSEAAAGLLGESD